MIKGELYKKIFRLYLHEINNEKFWTFQQFGFLSFSADFYIVLNCIDLKKFVPICKGFSNEFLLL